MALKLHNPRLASKTEYTYLAVPVLEDLKNSILSLSQSAVYAGMAFVAFNAIAMPLSVVTAATISTGYTALLHNYGNRTQRSLEAGRVNVVKAKPPKI